MEINNEEIREKLVNFLKENGVKSKFIADNTGLSNVSICLFLKGRRELAKDKLFKINNIIS